MGSSLSRTSRPALALHGNASKLLQRGTLQRGRGLWEIRPTQSHVWVAHLSCASTVRQSVLTSGIDAVTNPCIRPMALFEVIYPCTMSLHMLHEHAGAWAPDLTVAPSIYSCQGVPAAAKPRTSKFEPLCLNPAGAGCHQAALGVCRSCEGTSTRFLEAFQLSNSQTSVGASLSTCS